MTKEELLRENQELKDRIIELQSEIIRLKAIPNPSDVPPVEPYYPNYPSTTGDPLPPPYETTCGRNAMEWDESKKAFI